ncbi:MAG: adventurous gliding motility protein U [Bdellovibrio sp. 28-41-41]|nr:MAG: adventurous gliding motility protein U [Bdellovibrio sp. 28-41-41]
MNKLKVLTSLFILTASTPVFAKKTIGELFSNVGLENRGGKISKVNKGVYSIPKPSEIKFENRTEHNLDVIKPSKSYEILNSQNLTEIVEYEKILDEQIAELYKLTRKFKDSDKRGELWVRLAELYVEKGSLVDYRRQKEFDARLLQFNKGKSKVKPTLSNDESRSYFKKSVQLYEWFRKDFPSDPKIPQALYFLGFNYFELGEPKKGEKYYSDLSDRFPNSPFVDEANFALGEYNFENENWKEAYKRYSPVIKNKKHNLNAMATYKGAWCLYRLGRNQEALKYMEYIIKLNKQASDRDSKKQLKAKLEVEALRDIVVFYAAAGDADKASEYFEQMVGDQSLSYIEKLAYYYLDKGYKDAAHRTFKYLIDQRPTDPKAFEYQYQIVQVYFYAKNSQTFKTELYRWIREYGPASAWYKANQANTELTENSMKLREKTLRNWTLQQHQTAQNSRTSNSQKLAAEGYQLYLNEFTNSPQTADMHFYYGELLYDSKKFDEAGIQYKWIVDNAPESKFYENAATALLISVEKSLPDEKDLAQRNTKSLEPIPLTATVDRFLKASTWYLEKLPNSKKAPEIKFRQGRLMYQYNYFEDASKIFREIVQKYPNTKYAEYSANLLLDIYNLKKDYGGLEMAATELLKNEALAGTKAGQEIKEVLEKASFKKGQDLEQDKKFKESADVFMTFAQQNAKSNLAITAYFNAGVNYEKAGENEKAKNAYSQVLASKQDNKELKDKSKLFVAKLYQDAALFDESIKLYKQLVAEAKKPEQAKNYLYNIAVMKEAMGQYQSAIKDYETYSEMIKGYKERLANMFQIAELYRKTEAWSKAQAKYIEYVDAGAPQSEKFVEALYWIAYVHNRKGSSQAYSYEDRLIAMQKRLGGSTGGKWAAIVKLRRSKDTYHDFTEIKIPANPEKQKKAVDEKIGLLNKLNRELNDVVKLNHPDSIVSSLSMLGDANDHMAKAILNAPLPKGLDAATEKQYREQLPKLADPFKVRAKESYKLALERAWEFESYNEDYLKALKYMNAVDPVKYYYADEIKQDVRFINWMAL